MDPSAGKAPAIPNPLGVPIGVPLNGIFGGGGVPEYCARSIRRLGDPDMLGLPLAKSAEASFGPPISTGFDGVSLFDDGEDMAKDGGG